jgi:hypothetical protein
MQLPSGMTVPMFSAAPRSLRHTVDALLATMQALALSMEQSALHIERADRLCERSRRIVWVRPPARPRRPRQARVPLLPPSRVARARSSNAAPRRQSAATLLPFRPPARDSGD